MLPDLLLVDDNPAMTQMLGHMLHGMGRLRCATGGAAALGALRQQPADLVLLNAEMSGMNGFAVCAAMKAEPALADLPVIFITSHSDADFVHRGLAAGAVDFIAKPVSEALLLARVRTQLRIKRLSDELRQMAAIDALTGLANRRAFDLAFQREWQRAQREGTALSLLLVGIDHFQAYNDSYGQPEGDVCLHAVAQALATAPLRPADLAARYGGAEFALLLPQTDAAGADHVADRVLQAVAALARPHAASPTAAAVSVSVGAASLASDTKSPAMRAADLLDLADQALQAAKAGGRARACALPLATRA